MKPSATPPTVADLTIHRGDGRRERCFWHRISGWPGWQPVLVFAEFGGPICVELFALAGSARIESLTGEWLPLDPPEVTP